MPDRFIRESALISKSLAQLSHLAERLFWRLTTVADDYGRFSGEPAVIQGRCLPLVETTLKQVVAALDELEAGNMVRSYEVDGSKYVYFVNWSKYQQTRAKKSKYPDPPTFASKCKQMSANAPVFVCESVSECDQDSSLRSESSAAPESDAPEAASGPELSPSAQWPEEERWLLDFLDNEQRAFNGHHLPRLRDYEFWDLLSVETNGLSKDFVERGFAEMRRWLKDNPARGPTPKGVRRFVGGWLKRNAERERRQKA